jgi:rubrerythrin
VRSASIGRRNNAAQRIQDPRQPEGGIRRRIPGQPSLPLFRTTAEGETGHAHGHLEYLETCGDPATDLPFGKTRENLKAAIAGETHEYTDMYPGMAKSARTEGFGEIADWFETLAKAERSHANRFQKALDALAD